MPGYTHAGGLVVRPAAGGPVYLLVTARSDARHWLFPKGHIEPGETAETAALREVQEEAGVEATVVRPIGGSEYVLGRETVRTIYFLMAYRHDRPAAEARGLCWCPYAEARERLSFPDLRVLLDRAHAGPAPA